MTDQAFELLRAVLTHNSAQALVWVVDENIGSREVSAVSASGQLRAMTNRYDLQLALEQRGVHVMLSDYDFSALQKHSLDVIAYRISKEKALVHHIINAAAEYLKPSGLLYLAGYKNEGIKTYADKALKYLGELVDRQRGPDGSMLAIMRSSDIAPEPLDDKQYRQAVDIVQKEDGPVFISKPGLYGWNKIDKGSAFLIEYLPTYLQSLSVLPQRVADLGCGYGYLSVMAHRQLPAYYIATDNNIAAVNLCQKNFDRHQIQGRAVLGDCGSTITETVDLVLCNPPFHQGFGVETDLTLRFIEGAKRLLNGGGRALFVVNSFIALEKKAHGHFSAVTQLANNGSFKLIELGLNERHPRKK
jgi:16S rRNA (guanine1207-N2)-methyltransferase